MPVSYHPSNVSEFDELIKGDKLVVVDFHATWCGPCKIISPKFESFSDVYTDALFAKVDVDEVVVSSSFNDILSPYVSNN